MAEMGPEELVVIARRWLACFEKKDVDTLVGLYAEDATHASPKLRALHPETGGKIVGRAAMRAWWAGAFERLPALKYVIRSLTADGSRVWMEYVRETPGEADMPVAEVLDVEGGKIVASRVYHG